MVLSWGARVVFSETSTCKFRQGKQQQILTMNSVKNNTCYQRGIPFLVVLFSALVISCNGQDTSKKETSTSEEKKGSTVPTNANANFSFYENGQGPVVDPLFYIEGQLCQHLRKIFQDSKGNLWFGTNVYDLMRYDGDILDYFGKKDGVGGGRINGMVEDAEGNVWFGTYGGLTKYDGATFTNYTFEFGKIKNDIWSLTIDSKGLFWIGTTYGLVRFDGTTFTPFPLPKAKVQDAVTNYSFDRITAILEDKNGIFWIGTDGFGITRYDPSVPLGGNAFSHLTKKEGLPDNVISGLMQDSQGNIWIATMFGGVSTYDGTAFHNYTQDGTVGGIEVGALYEDKKGHIWFAAENQGVYRFDGTHFTHFSAENGLNTNAVLSIYEDKEGRFWLGGWGGLFRYDGRSIVSVTREGPWK